MLISITDKCRMNCTHCFEDAKETNNHFMSFDTFRDAVDFNLKYDNTILISGGEPTEHPEFWKFIEYVTTRVQDGDGLVTIATNGMNLVKNRKAEELIQKYYITNRKSLEWQVTNDVRYYPIRVNGYERVFRCKSVRYVDHIQSMYPQGRAGNNKTDNITVPKCFNLRSAVRSVGFEKAIHDLRLFQKFCTPKIIYNGDIKVGESHLCPTVCSIYDDIEDINYKIKHYTCRGCDILTNNMSIEAKLAIGEDRNAIEGLAGNDPTVDVDTLDDLVSEFRKIISK